MKVCKKVNRDSQDHVFILKHSHCSQLHRGKSPKHKRYTFLTSNIGTQIKHKSPCYYCYHLLQEMYVSFYNHHLVLGVPNVSAFFSLCHKKSQGSFFYRTRTQGSHAQIGGLPASWWWRWPLTAELSSGQHVDPAFLVAVITKGFQVQYLQWRNPHL